MAMNIGEKIRSLRVAKLMTQSELAGNQITRNMLSSIENGKAQPSLSTIQYIASVLKVPVGFLLAEEGDEIVYQKMNGLANIKRAYRAEDWIGCRNLCLSSCPEPDDEIRLILAGCDLEIAKAAFWEGKIRYACRFFDEAILYANETIYPAQHVIAEAAVYFRYMERISSTLYSDVMDHGDEGDFVCKNRFSMYLDALDALDHEDESVENETWEIFESGSFFKEHLTVKLLMKKENYEAAKAKLLGLLEAEILLNEVSLYAVLTDLEVCCRETEDFKGAYQYTNERVTMLEKLLREN